MKYLLILLVVFMVACAPKIENTYRIVTEDGRVITHVASECYSTPNITGNGSIEVRCYRGATLSLVGYVKSFELVSK